MIDRSEKKDTSGVAQTTGYIINLGVAAVVVTLLLMHGQSTLTTISATSMEAELKVTGERVSMTLSEADRLQRVGGEGEGEIPLRLFDLVSDDFGGYEVNVSDSPPGERGEIVLRPSHGTEDVEVVHTFNVESEVHGGEFSSAEDVSVVYNESGVFVTR